MRPSRTTAPAVNLRRAYFESRHGQLHVRTAFPSTGGFDERVTLLCLHDAGATSRAFVPFLPEIGTDRSVYAPDAPGTGESDPQPPAAAPATIAEAAAAIGDLLTGLRLREADVLGVGQGAVLAVELALARPKDIRRVVAIGLAPERAGRLAQPSLALAPADAAEPAALAARVRAFLDR